MSLYQFGCQHPKHLSAGLLKAFDETLSEFLPIEGIRSGAPNAAAVRLDFLTRLVEALRYEHRHYTCKLRMEDFVAMDVFPDKGKIVAMRDRHPPNLGSTFDAIQMQPLLLQFLVLRVDPPESIYDTIEKFIKRIESDLTVLDFQHSLTGVLRCFTNARIAASRLGRYGFIRAARGDMTRKWVPSLPGLVVAYLLNKDPGSYMKLRGKKLAFWVVHPAIRHIWQQIEKYDAFLSVIRSVCVPNILEFDTFEPMLQSMHEMLSEFFQQLMLGEEKHRDKVIEEIRAGDAKKAVAVLRQVESDAQYEKFVNQFGISLQMLDLLGDG